MTEYDEKFPIAPNTLVNLRKRLYNGGCIAEAYTITIQTTIENVVKLSKAEGFEYSALYNNLFPERSQAIVFIHNTLFKIKNKSTPPK